MSWFSRIFGVEKSAAVPATSMSESASMPDGPPELTPLQVMAMEQATSFMHQVNESLQLANNSTNPKTKVSRLEFARSRLTEMQLLAQFHPFIKLQRLESVQRTITQLAEEFSEAGYYVKTDESCRDYRQDVWKNISFPSADIIKGRRFSATMQLRTPLRVLSRHGEIHEGLTDPPTIAQAMWEGFWTPLLKSNIELGMPDVPEVVMRDGTMASDVGPIPVDGGDYLKFLFKIRAIVEAFGGIEVRRTLLREELRKPEWADFCRKLGGKQTVVNQLFPPFIETIKGLPANAVASLWDDGFMTPTQIAAVADVKLLAIKGIGLAKLKFIRSSCDSATDKESEFVDLVER